MFISNALAQDVNTAADYVAANSASGTLIQLGIIFLIFYFLLIRPQQKRMKEHDAMLAAIKRGDKIITGGGIYATVIKAENDVLTVSAADNVEFKVARFTVREVLNEKAPVAETPKTTTSAKNKKKTSKK